MHEENSHEFKQQLKAEHYHITDPGGGGGGEHSA